MLTTPVPCTFASKSCKGLNVKSSVEFVLQRRSKLNCVMCYAAKNQEGIFEYMYKTGIIQV